MVKCFMVSGTGPRAGRTTVGCALAFALKVRGLRVGVIKPAATGCAERNGVLAADDAAALLAAASSDLPLELAAPWCARSPLAPMDAAQADAVDAPDYAAIERALGEIANRSDVVIVEDSYGLAAKLDPTRDFADLARAHRLELILVIGVSATRPGFADAAKRALEYADARGIAVRGAILNALDAQANATIAQDADAVGRATGVRVLGTMRFKEPLSLAIVEQLL
jgi:dethiobiotin synthetase